MQSPLTNMQRYYRLLHQLKVCTQSVKSVRSYSACVQRLSHHCDSYRPLLVRHVCTSSKLSCAATDTSVDVVDEDVVLEGEDEVQGDVVPSNIDDLNSGLTDRVNVVSVIRTDVNDPAQHTMADDGLFYTVKQKYVRRYIFPAQRKDFNRRVTAFGECALMVRKPALEVFDLIDNADLNLPPLRIFLYGKVGSGKSMTLSHIVHRYATQGWLVVHVPSMMDMIRFNPNPKFQRELYPSTYNESRFDWYDLSVNWLRIFVQRNKSFLEKLKTSKSYEWSERESCKEGDSLHSIAMFGLTRKKFASDIIGVILKEIKQQAPEKGIKVLVAVDGVNGFYRTLTPLKKSYAQYVNVTSVSFFHHLAKMFQPNWSHGVCVGTLCSGVDAVDKHKDQHLVPYTPAYLLNEKGFVEMDPFVPVYVPEFSTKEAYHYIQYLIEMKWINKPRGCSEEGKKELIAVSNKNPNELMKLTALW